MKSTAVENVTLVCVEARIWTAVRQLSEADAKQVSQKAKGGIVKPGSLRVFPKAPLAAFSVIKAKAESLLKKEGVRFAGSYVIPNSKLPDVLSRLAVLKSEFEKEICTFLSGYASERSKWIGLNSEYAGLIEKYSLPEAEVQRRFFFKHLHFGLACATASEAASAAGAIADAAIAETARKFGELSACSSEGGNCVAGHTVAAVARLGQKLKTLSSLPGMARIASLVEDAVAGLPQKGKITGFLLEKFRAFCLACADESRLKEIVSEACSKQDEEHEPESMTSGLAPWNGELPQPAGTQMAFSFDLPQKESAGIGSYDLFAGELQEHGMEENCEIDGSEDSDSFESFCESSDSDSADLSSCAAQSEDAVSEELTEVCSEENPKDVISGSEAPSHGECGRFSSEICGSANSEDTADSPFGEFCKDAENGFWFE